MSGSVPDARTRAPWRAGAPTTGIAVLAAVVGGFVLRTAFPAPSVWILAPVGVAVSLWAFRGRSPRGGAVVGLVGGLAFFLPLIEWIRFFLGEAGANGVGLVLLIALATFMSLWGALSGAIIASAYRAAERIGRAESLRGRVVIVPLVVAGVWTAREGLSATVPWGGFSWGRVGFSQAGGALDGLFSWIGTAGVTFVVVLLSALVVELVADPPPRLGGLPATALAIALVLVPAWPVPTRGSIEVGGVQGDTKSSYADPPEFVGDVLRAQVAETRRLDDRAKQEGRRLDLVIWPEGGSDQDPLTNPYAADLWSRVVERTGAPLLGWSVTQRGKEYFNTSLLWTADGASSRYDKRHPVPFGEYVPARAVFHAIVPDLVDLLQREYTPGRRGPVIALPDDRRAGVFICFDIADDALLRESVGDGAEFLVAPSNNTDFGRGSDESAQQLQIAQVRALESGRTVVGVSTVATSAVIAPDGTITHRLPTWRPGTIISRVPLAHGATPATVIGGVLEPFLGATGVAGWLALVVRSGRRRDTELLRPTRADRAPGS